MTAADGTGDRLAGRPAMLGVLALSLGAACIALAPIMVKLSPVGPQASAFWRLAIALPALLVWAALEQAHARRIPRGDAPVRRAPVWCLMALAGVLFAADLATWHAALMWTSAANATFLSNLTPIVVVAVTWWTTRVWPQRSYFLAVALALGGALLLSGGAPGLDRQALAGDALGALTAIWYGLYILVVARLRAHAGAGMVMLGSSVVAAAACLAFALWVGEPLLPAAAHAGSGMGDWLMVWWPLLVLGIVAHVGGQGLLAVGFGLVPTHVASVVILLQPVLVAILGVAWLGEVLGPLQWLGGALVLCGVWLARRTG